jgi:hypothetical protein
MAKKNYEQIRVDLRPYGWGIRDVDMIPPDTELGPDSVGSEEIKDCGVQMQDLSQEVQTKLNNAVDRQTLNDTVTQAVNEAVTEAVSEAVTEASEESVRSIVKDWQLEEEPEPEPGE